MGGEGVRRPCRRSDREGHAGALGGRHGRPDREAAAAWPPHSDADGFRRGRDPCPTDMDMTVISPASLLDEIAPLYVFAAIAFLWCITVKRALFGKPKLTLF